MNKPANIDLFTYSHGFVKVAKTKKHNQLPNNSTGEHCLQFEHYINSTTLVLTKANSKLSPSS